MIYKVVARNGNGFLPYEVTRVCVSLWSKQQHTTRTEGLRPTVSRPHDFLKDNMAQPSTFPRSHLLIFGPNSVQSLLPVTPISQVEALLDDHRIEDVIQLVDQQRKKVQSKLVVDASEVRRSSLPCRSSFKWTCAGGGTGIRLSATRLPMPARNTLRRRRFLSLPRRTGPAHPHLLLPLPPRHPTRRTPNTRRLRRRRGMHAPIRLNRRPQYVSPLPLSPYPQHSQ
jgi:hypothetical protein